MFRLLARIWCKIPRCWKFDYYGDMVNYTQYYMWLFGKRRDVWKQRYNKKGQTVGYDLFS